MTFAHVQGMLCCEWLVGCHVTGYLCFDWVMVVRCNMTVYLSLVRPVLSVKGKVEFLVFTAFQSYCLNTLDVKLNFIIILIYIILRNLIYNTAINQFKYTLNKINSSYL